MFAMTVSCSDDGSESEIGIQFNWINHAMNQQRYDDVSHPVFNADEILTHFGKSKVIIPSLIGLMSTSRRTNFRANASKIIRW